MQAGSTRCYSERFKQTEHYIGRKELHNNSNATVRNTSWHVHCANKTNAASNVTDLADLYQLIKSWLQILPLSLRFWRNCGIYQYSIFLTLRAGENWKESWKKEEIRRKSQFCLSNDHIKPRDCNELHPLFLNLITQFD